MVWCAWVLWKWDGIIIVKLHLDDGVFELKVYRVEEDDGELKLKLEAAIEEHVGGDEEYNHVWIHHLLFDVVKPNFLKDPPELVEAARLFVDAYLSILEAETSHGFIAGGCEVEEGREVDGDQDS